MFPFVVFCFSFLRLTLPESHPGVFDGGPGIRACVMANTSEQMTVTVTNSSNPAVSLCGVKTPHNL